MSGETIVALRERLRKKVESVRLFCGRPIWTVVVLTVLSLLVSLPSLWITTRAYPTLVNLPIWGSYFQNPVILLVNILPPLVLLWGITLLTKCPWAGYLMMSAVTLVLSLGNYFKISLRGDPVIVTDLGLLGDAALIVGEYSLNFNGAVWFVMLSALLGLALTVLLLPLVLPLTWQKRVVGVVGSLLIAVVLFFGVYTSDTFYELTRNETHISRWSQAESYISRGLWYPFLNSVVDHSAELVNSYQGDVEALLEERSADKTADIQPITDVSSDVGLTVIPDIDIIPRDERVVEEDRPISVVSIMLEAFCDLTDFETLAQYEGVQDAYSIWRQLESESLYGDLVTNSFGGGTVNTEWSFLTGLPDFASFTYNTDSYVWYLRSLGYTTQGSHPGYAEFYDRVSATHYLGFETYRFAENYYADFIDPAAAFWRSDDILVDGVLNDLEGAFSLGNPVFSHSITYQNHGPYDEAADMSDPAIPETDELDDYTRGIIQSYLNGIVDTQEELLRLTEELDTMAEPVVLVLFGDHKPWLGNDYSCYLDADVSFDQSTDEGVYNYYNTPYLIWANQAARDRLGQVETGESDTISPCFLMNKVFQFCGWEEPAAMEISSEMMEVTPVVHQTGRYLYEETFVESLPIPFDDQLAEFYALHKYRREMVYFP